MGVTADGDATEALPPMGTNKSAIRETDAASSWGRHNMLFDTGTGDTIGVADVG